MEKLTYTNSLDESIVIATNSSTYRLKNLKLKPMKDKPQTSKGYQQNGVDFNDAFALQRDIVFSFIIFGNGLSDQFEKRREVKRLMNPQLGEGTLRYQNDYITKEITVKIDQEPGFDTTKKNFGFHSQICGISMTAFNPYWRDLTDTEVELVSLSDPFYWDDPEYLNDAGAAFYLGTIGSGSAVATNSGDVPAPLRIEWVGTATDPKVLLEDTGEFILLDGNVASGEKLIITTGYGDINVYIETISTGVTVKDFSLVDPTSTFFRLPLGNSTISLSAVAGSGAAAVTLIYKNLFTGV